MIQSLNKTYIFIDESGTPAKATENESHLYFHVGIFIDEDDVEDARIRIHEIQSKYFSGSEIKSSNVRKNHERRIKILKELDKIKYKYISLIVNKSKISHASGLKYARTFKKVMLKKIILEVAKYYANVEIISDRVGRPLYEDSFARYFDSQRLDDFFETDFKHKFLDSKDEELIQIADFVSGTLSYIFDESKISDFSKEFYELLKKKKIKTFCFPESDRINYLARFEENKELYVDNEDNEKIFRAMISAGQKFVLDNEDKKDDVIRAQVYVVKKLLDKALFPERKRSNFYSDYFVRKLKENDIEFSRRSFTSNVIAKLRNKGIVITGKPDGYKLAISLIDIKEYLDHDANIILPMLYRLRQANESLFTKAGVQIWIDETHKDLEKLSTVIEESKLSEFVKSKEIKCIANKK